MQDIISLDVFFASSETGFSLDELVYRTRELFDTEGLPGLVGLILRLVDERVCHQWIEGKFPADQPVCCKRSRYRYHDRLGRQFRTTVGRVRVPWRRLQCTGCGRTVIPLRVFLGLEAYQSKTTELEKVVAEVVSEQSYRRSSRHLDVIGHIPVPKSTAHRWVAQSDCDRIDPGKETFEVLFADGTGYKRRPDSEANVNNRGELRVALGVDQKGSLVPLGAFSGQSWDAIAAQIRGERKDAEPVADTLVSDGEPGLIESLESLCRDRQRCHWHVVHDLDHRMWEDGAAKDLRRQSQKDLAAIIGIELPKEAFEKVKEEDKQSLAQSATQAQSEVTGLIGRLREKGYQKAADYLSHAADNLFGYVRRWLRTGIVTPRVSSRIERMMRELARRLKRMAFGWSEAGAAKMARILIKRFTSSGQWEKYWKEKLRIQDNVMLVLRDIKPKHPQPLGR